MPTSFQPGPEVVYRRIGDETVLADLRADLVYSLNETGSCCWELLAEGLERRQIEKRMASEFAVDEAELRLEIDGFLERLIESGLITARADE